MSGGYDIEIDRRTLMQYAGAGTLASGIAALAGCVESDDGISEIRITLSQFPTTIDPLDHITGDYFDVYDHIYPPLFDFQPGEGISDWSAEDWDPQGDGTTQLTLRDDLVFHNGDDVTAEDVAYTINRTVDPDQGPESPIGSFGLGSIESAEAADDLTVEVSHSGAPGLAEFEIGNYARAMNMSWTQDRDGDEGAITGDSVDDFNGHGPYEVVDYTSEVDITLEPFDDWWGDDDQPFDEIVFDNNEEASGRLSSLEAGESDLTINILPEDVTTVQETDGIEIRDVISFRNIFCPMKNVVEPFDSLEFRQAMNYAVDNEEIISTVLNGFGNPMSQPAPPDVNGYNPDLETYDQDIGMAESLVEDSGYGGAELELYVPNGRYLNDVEVGETVADQISQLENVDCSAEVVEFDVVSTANNAGLDPDEFDIPFYLIGWGVITGDTDYAVSGFFASEAQTFEDEDITSAIEDTQSIEDPDEREQELQAVNEMIRDQAPFIFLHQQPSIYGVNADIDWEPREDEVIYAWEMSS